MCKNVKIIFHTNIFHEFGENCQYNKQDKTLFQHILYMVAYFCPLHARYVMSACNIINLTCNLFISTSNITMLTCNFIKSHVHIIISHFNIIILHVNIVMLHVDIPYLACRGQKNATRSLGNLIK